MLKGTVKTAQLHMTSFAWKVAEAGYQWKRSIRSRQHLYERNVPGGGFRIYHPMTDTPGLFREFVNLGGKEDIVEFANKYGVLFDRYSLDDGIGDKGKYWSIGAHNGTSLAVWGQEIADMSVLVAIWDSITSERISDLKRIIFWKEKDGERGVEYKIETPKHITSEWLALPGAPHPFGEGDLLLPARYALRREINKRLSDEFNDSDVNKIACAPRLVWNPDGSQALAIMPPNLLGAMWLQFAQFASGRYQLKTCPGCGKYFQAGEGAPRRADAITCSDKCRQRKKRNP